MAFRRLANEYGISFSKCQEKKTWRKSQFCGENKKMTYGISPSRFHSPFYLSLYIYISTSLSLTLSLHSLSLSLSLSLSTYIDSDTERRQCTLFKTHPNSYFYYPFFLNFWSYRSDTKRYYIPMDRTQIPPSFSRP